MKRKKILFACISFDGHFNPLTGMAKHFQELGYDVRWYAGDHYKDKLSKLNIPRYPFVNAQEVTAANINAVYPALPGLKSQVGKLQYTLKHFFVQKAEEYFLDIEKIHSEFPFDVFVSDMLFTASLLVKEKLHVPLMGIGISPLCSTSQDLAPPGLGMTPSTGFLGRQKNAFLRFITKNIIFSDASKTYNIILKKHNIKPVEGVFIDAIVKRSDIYLQSGAQAFDYKRSDLGENIRYVGALQPFNKNNAFEFKHEQKLKLFKKVILVTQGTAEPESNKLIIPTMEAFKNTDYLVIVTTSGSNTKALQAAYPQGNIIIEDFIDYNYIMPHAHVFVTNGGYGGVLLAISKQLPMVAAGVHEGKCEITARVGYFNLGIDLKTEFPSKEQIFTSVLQVLNNPVYKQNVAKVAEEFKKYETYSLCSKFLSDLLPDSNDDAVSNKFKNEATFKEESVL